MKKINIIERRTKVWTLRIFTLLMLLSFAYQSIAQNIFTNPQLKAQVSIDTNRMMVGQQTDLHLQIEVPKKIVVIWPVFTDTITKNIEIISTSDIDTIPSDEGKIILRQTLRITSFDSGYFPIPPFNFMYSKEGDNLNSQINMVESNALLLEVQNVKVDLKKEIKDIKPIIAEPWTFGEILPYLLWALLVFLIIVFAFYFYYRRKQNKPLFSFPKKPKIPAHIIALQKLDKLSEQKLWQTGSSKEFYSNLTDIMREYMEGQMQFNAMEMISDDIFQKLENKDLNNELYNETKSILQTADLVKFAKLEPLADENNSALKWGYKFVDSTKPVEEESSSTTKSKSEVEPLKTSNP